MISYLPQLAKAGGKELLLANLMSDNCSIESHYRNYIDENEVYTYETYLPGITEAMRPDGIALHEAVEDDEWDIIIFSQNIALSGIRESYNPYLAELSAYCRLMIPGARTMLIEPWAYEPGCEKKAFVKAYNSDSEEMASRISECCSLSADTAEIDRVTRLGRVWQAVRNSGTDISLTSDGESASKEGEFLSSCILYRELFSESADCSGLDLKDIPADTTAFLSSFSSHI